MEKVEGSNKGVLVLATVKGDVHDIGKNLVDIILTNNGYKVVNLGIKQPIDDILRSWEETKADAIGMSGLLVKSTLVMRDNLELMNERGINVPVILGGAALNRRYVDADLIPLYNGKLYYARDAFDGCSNGRAASIGLGSGFRFWKSEKSGKAAMPEKKIRKPNPDPLGGGLVVEDAKLGALATRVIAFFRRSTKRLVPNRDATDIRKPFNGSKGVDNGLTKVFAL